MKRTYKAPSLTSHGTVSKITAASLDSGKSDLLYGTSRGTVPGNGGSFDACVTADQESCRNAAGAAGRSGNLRP
ncbi:MAG: lasso peptide [Rhizonema sp. NSF051]|nr:lasso peptide [Rhizonema sp. NSF051]